MPPVIPRRRWRPRYPLSLLYNRFERWVRITSIYDVLPHPFARPRIVGIIFTPMWDPEDSVRIVIPRYQFRGTVRYEIELLQWTLEVEQCLEEIANNMSDNADAMANQARQHAARAPPRRRAFPPSTTQNPQPANTEGSTPQQPVNPASRPMRQLVPWVPPPGPTPPELEWNVPRNAHLDEFQEPEWYY